MKEILFSVADNHDLADLYGRLQAAGVSVTAVNGRPAPTGRVIIENDADEAAALAVIGSMQSTDDWLGSSKLDRAILLTILDQLNVLRTKAGLPVVTPQQAKQAVLDKINGGV